MPEEAEDIKKDELERDEEIMNFSLGVATRRGDDFNMSPKDYNAYLADKGCPKDLVQKLWDAQDELAQVAVTELLTPRMIEADRPVAFYAGAGNGKLKVSEIPQRTTEINIPGREPKKVTKFGPITYGISRTLPRKWYEPGEFIDSNAKLVSDAIAAKAAKALKK